MTSIDLTTLSGYESLAAGSYQLAVRAKAAGYTDSDLSSTASFMKLASPVVTAADTTVTWDAITNAESYDVYVDGVLYENTTGGASFVQVPLIKDESLEYTRISGMDTTKTYSVSRYNTDTNSFADTVLIILWNGTEWIDLNYDPDKLHLQPPSADYHFTGDYVYIIGYGGSFSAWVGAACLEGTSAATKEDFNKLATPENNLADWECIIEGTHITLADRTTKPIEDITYDDNILVWNFYESKFDSAKPCWIMKPQIATEYNLCKFSNGAEVGFVGQGGNIGYHRIYNDEAKAFTHTGVAETPVGTHTFAEDESFPELVSQEVIKKPVRYYNVGTTNHINLFANGILTSSRISNKYAIEDMKYVGERLISEEDEQKYIEKALVRC